MTISGCKFAVAAAVMAGSVLLTGSQANARWVPQYQNQAFYRAPSVSSYAVRYGLNQYSFLFFGLTRYQASSWTHDIYSFQSYGSNRSYYAPTNFYQNSYRGPASSFFVNSGSGFGYAGTAQYGYGSRYSYGSTQNSGQYSYAVPSITNNSSQAYTASTSNSSGSSSDESTTTASSSAQTTTSSSASSYNSGTVASGNGSGNFAPYVPQQTAKAYHGNSYRPIIVNYYIHKDIFIVGHGGGRTIGSNSVSNWKM